MVPDISIGNTAFQCIPVTTTAMLQQTHLCPFPLPGTLLHMSNSQYLPAAESTVKQLVTCRKNFVWGKILPLFLTAKFPPQNAPPPPEIFPDPVERTE